MVVLVAALLVQAPASAAPRSATTVREYRTSSSILANPDRGRYHHTELHTLPGLGGAPLDAGTVRAWRRDEAVTVVYRVYYLEGYRDRPLDDVFLGRLGADLDAARSGGAKLVLRFAYSAGSAADAEPARVLGHIDQLAPVLARGADVLLAVQAGFVGRWGEWYYSDHFSDDAERPWSLSEASWSRRMLVLRRLAERLPSSVPLQVRYPEIADRFRAVDPQLAGARLIGVHDDCLGADATDAGTFGRPHDRAWVARRTALAPMGGETCGVNEPWSSWPVVQRALVADHWSFLNLDYHQGVLDSWGDVGQAEVDRRLGYRIRAVRSSCVCRARSRQTVRVSITLTNDGYAAPFSPYQARLVMRSRSTTVQRPLDLDLRRVVPGRPLSVEAAVPAPARAGGYQLYLAFAPPAPSLAARPEYAVRLANEGTWVADRGWNDLGQRLAVVKR